MRIPGFITQRLALWANRYMIRHPVYQVITGETGQDVLIYRWDLLDLPGFHVRLHSILGSDYGRDLHDHPWWNCTIVLDGRYNEITPWQYGDPYDFGERGAPDRVMMRETGDVVLRGALARHRIVLGDRAVHFFDGLPVRFTETPALTLFIHGRNKRAWGFWKDGQFTPATKQKVMS
jgi:hypothetical protein